MNHYCQTAPGHPLHGPYHDREYGFPIRQDAELFGRLVLEINQAGLSWLTILKKKKAFERSYRGFELDLVAAFTEKDRVRLLGDKSIIRNRLKIDAAIYNASQLLGIREEFGSFADWLDFYHTQSKAEWVAMFASVFRFTGAKIVEEFLMSIGYLPGAQLETCPIQQRICKLSPPWMLSG